MLRNTIEDRIRGYIEESLTRVITKIAMTGSAFPVSFCKVIDQGENMEITDITHDDLLLKAVGFTPKGYGMYSHDRLDEFEKDTENVEGSVAMIYVLPVKFFESASEEVSGTQHYRIGYFGVQDGKLIGGERQLSIITACSVDPVQDAGKILRKYEEYLGQHREAGGSDDVEEHFRKKIWPALEPKVWVVPNIRMGWGSLSMNDSPYKNTVKG